MTTAWLAWGQRLRERRLACDLSQTQLAEAVGTAQRTVSRWELGDAIPDDAKLRLARALDTTAAELFPWDLIEVDE